MKNIIWLLDETADFFVNLDDAKVAEFREASRAIRGLMNAGESVMQFYIGGFVPRIFFTDLGDSLKSVKGDGD